MKNGVSICLVFVGIIHLLPLSGVVGAERLSALYGITIDDTNLEILLQHRAVLFGLLGSFLLAAAFIEKYQWAAIIGTGISAAVFILIAMIKAPYSESIDTVVITDIAVLLVLVIATALKAKSASHE